MRTSDTLEAGTASAAVVDDVIVTLSRLISYYDLEGEARVIHDLFNLICLESLLGFNTSCDRACSAINGNGFPFQFSVSLGAATRSLRCLGEVAAIGTSMPERLRLSTLRLREILSLLGRRSASPEINRLFEILFPGDAAATLGWTGGIWMGFGAARGHPLSFRLYLNQRWGDVTERFVRIGQALAALGRSQSLQDWKRIGATVSAGAIPYGIAFDVMPLGVGCFKVYLACSGGNLKYLETLLDCVGLSHLRDRVAFLIGQCSLDRPGLRSGAVLPSLEFSAEPGYPIGLKVDISCHHLQTSDVEMDKRIRTCLREFSLPLEEYEVALQAMSSAPLVAGRVARIQYCGVGLETGDAVRFNIYLCPEVRSLRPA